MGLGIHVTGARTNLSRLMADDFESGAIGWQTIYAECEYSCCLTTQQKH